MISRLGTRMLLEEVAELIDGQRAKDYGEPQDSFDTIAQLWMIYLEKKWPHIKQAEPLNVFDVADLMVLLKCARNMGERKTKDNYADMCGYAGLAGSHFIDVSKHDKDS